MLRIVLLKYAGPLHPSVHIVIGISDNSSILVSDYASTPNLSPVKTPIIR